METHKYACAYRWLPLDTKPTSPEAALTNKMQFLHQIGTVNEEQRHELPINFRTPTHNCTMCGEKFQTMPKLHKHEAANNCVHDRSINLGFPRTQAARPEKIQCTYCWMKFYSRKHFQIHKNKCKQKNTMSNGGTPWELKG